LAGIGLLASWTAAVAAAAAAAGAGDDNDDEEEEDVLKYSEPSTPSIELR